MKEWGTGPRFQDERNSSLIVQCGPESKSFKQKGCLRRSVEHNTWPMTVGVMATWEGQANSSWNGPGKLSRKGSGMCGQLRRGSWAESSVQCCSPSRSGMNITETEAFCLRLEQGRQRSSSCWRRGLLGCGEDGEGWDLTGLYYY